MPGETIFSTRVERATFGLNGKFGSSTWSWDANYDYGLTHHDQMVHRQHPQLRHGDGFGCGYKSRHRPAGMPCHG